MLMEFNFPPVTCCTQTVLDFEAFQNLKVQVRMFSLCQLEVFFPMSFPPHTLKATVMLLSYHPPLHNSINRNACTDSFQSLNKLKVTIHHQMKKKRHQLLKM